MAEGRGVFYDEVRNIRNAISMERNDCYERSSILSSSTINFQRNTIGEQVTSRKTSRVCLLITGSLVCTFLTVLILLSVAMAAWSGFTTVKCQQMISDFCTKKTNLLSETQQTVKELKNLVLDLRSQFSSLIDQDVSITLNNVSLFMDCNTTIEETCTIPTDQPQCITGYGTTYQKPGEFIMDMSCVRQTPSSRADQNGMSFILSIDDVNNEVKCLCYVVTLVGGTGPRQVETCGLRVTRCRTFSTITSTATLTSSP